MSGILCRTDERALRETVSALLARTRAIVLELEAYQTEVARPAPGVNVTPLLAALAALLSDESLAGRATEALTAGERVARCRKARGMSQQAVAELLGRSQSWLTKVERGKRQLDRMSVIAGVAQVLRVDVTEITGQGHCPCHGYSGTARRMGDPPGAEGAGGTGSLRRLELAASALLATWPDPSVGSEG